MKPIIIVCGVNHSGTSLVAKLLIDNGGYIGETDSGPTDATPYEKYEDKVLKEYISSILQGGTGSTPFAPPDTHTAMYKHLNELPDKVCILKHPKAVFHLDTFDAMVPRKIKVVFVLRELYPNIESIISKTGLSDEDAYVEYSLYHYWLCKYGGSIHVTCFERILEDKGDEISRLLEFCELDANDYSKEAINTEMVTFK